GALAMLSAMSQRGVWLCPLGYVSVSASLSRQGSWRCAVVETGLVGQTHVRVIPHVAGAALVAVCDTTSGRARAVLEKYNLPGVPAYTDLREMLRKGPQFDVVHLATPSGAHLEPATEAMNAGKHVICEKPLEIKLDRVDKMIR